MKTRIFGCCLAFLVLASAQTTPKRIVSLVPSMTEVLFAIGAGDEVVGVSSYDKFPPEVMSKPRVGALIDPDFERILSLKPDLVIVYASQNDVIDRLRRVGIPIFVSKHAGLADVTVSIRELGARLGRSERAAQVVGAIERDLADIKQRVAGRTRPKTALFFGREPGTLRAIYASAGIGFMHDMLLAAGGDDAFGDVKRENLQVTVEVLLARAPEVIIEVHPAEGWTPERLLKEQNVWNTLSSLPAVKSKRVHLLADDRLWAPGPRIAEGVRRLAEILHPEAFRGSAFQAQPTAVCAAGLDGSSTDLPIPTLAAPPGVAVTPFRPARSGNRSSYTCSLRYGSGASAVAIADHVNAQMTTMGWRLAERDANASLVLGRYTGSSTGGVPLSAVTIVAALDGTPAYEVAVQIVRQEVADARPLLPPLAGRAGGEGAAARGDAVMALLDGLLRTTLPVMGGSAYVEGTSLPPAFPAEILPKGTDVRLSATNKIHSTVVGLAPSLTVFALPPHFIAVNRSGWIGRGPGDGLMVGPDPPAVDLCRGTETARLDFVPLPGGGLAIRARHSREPSVRCDASVFGAGSFHDVAMPILMPSGFRTFGSSGGVGSERFDSEIHGYATADAESTAKELASQLVKGGWTLVSQPRVGPVRVIRARNANAAGDPVTALLVITPVSESSRMNLWLHVVRHKPVPRAR